MEELIKTKDAEITKLLIENRQLVDELRQCQADKEFVWSLWKRLQVSSPDLTQAISIVMEREREKTESKDRKVLEILQTKDEEIKNLHKTVSQIKTEKEELYKIKTSLEVESDTKLLNIENLEKEISKLKSHLEKSRTDNVEKSDSYKRSMKEVEEQRDDLKVKMTGFLTDIQEMRTKLQNLEDENRGLNEKNMRLNDDVIRKNELVRKSTEEKDRVELELEDLRQEYSQIRTGASEDIRSHEQRYRELREAFEQTEEQNQQQNNLIEQLQSLQSSTKQVLSQQEEAFRNEKKSLQQVNRDLLDANENLQEKQLNLRKENDLLKRRVEKQELSLQESEKELRKAIEMATGAGKDYYYRDFKGLEEKIEDQRREIAALQRRLGSNRGRRNSPHASDGGIDQTFSPIVERGMGCQVPRSRSLSPCAQSRQLLLLQKKLKATETKLDDTKQLLELKKDEVRELQRAHNKRLERLKVLQQDYRKRNTKHRSRSRDLRQENSESVWNELARFKQDNRALTQKRLSLEEELDALRVQSAMDRATIQDLNICLKQERDEMAARMRSARREEDRLSSTPKSKIESSRVSSKNMKNLERKLENAVEDNKVLKKDKKRLLQDNRNLKDEVKSLKLEITDTRQSGTKLRLETTNLRHQLEKVKSENDLLDGEVQTIKTEAETLKDENLILRNESTALREENNELQQEIADLKLELADINAELKDRSSYDVEPERKKKGKGWKSPSAKKHQKFLNKSVHEMQAAFGDQFAPHRSSTSASEDVGRSDASSLGQSIVKACRRQKKDDDKDDDDDTLVEDSPPNSHRSSRPSSRRVSYLPRHGDNGMMITLKHRLSSLQTQCTSLRAAKQNAFKKLNEEKEKTIQLESELTTCQNKLKNFKQSIQRLNREVEVLQREREDLQQALSEAKCKQPEPQVHTDADYKYLESKLKLSNGETTRINEQLKDTKKDLERKIDQLTTEKEKVTRFERDVSMKRQLIDELRIKTKENETKLKDEYNAKMDLQERLKVIEEDVNHKKNHIESIRRQLQACTKEKAKYEMMYNKAREEIEKRCEQLSSAQACKLEAESATSRMEQEAEQQLQALANRSEQALEKLKSRLEKSEEKLGEFGIFVQNISSHLVELLCRQRECLSREKENVAESRARLIDSGNRYPSSMSHAQKVACDILNMSRSDFEDLMAPVDASKRKAEDGDARPETYVATQQDDMWRMKVEKIATENPPFAKSLSRLIWDKVQDVVRITEEKCQVRTDQLEEELVNRKKF